MRYILSDRDRNILVRDCVEQRDRACNLMASAADDHDIARLRLLLQDYDECAALAEIVTRATEIDSDS